MNKMRKLIKNNKGQIWVETVVYTLIFIVLIGMVLAFVTPAIQEQKDKATIENSINAMLELDAGISEIKRVGPGNVRENIFLIKKGELRIEGENNKIIF